MSDEDKPLEFSALDLMPQWAQETSKPKDKKQRPAENRGESKRGERRDTREGGDRRSFGGDRRGGGGGDRRGQGQGRRDFGGGERRGGGGGRNDRRGGGGPRRGGRDDRGRNERPPEDKPAPGVKASIEPTESAVKGLAKHIRETQRAFPLADLAKMILNGRDRYQVCFESTDENSRLFQCTDDETVWVTRDEALKHILNSNILEKYYEVEEVDIGAPSGNFSVIAVCGMSGEILGPPNHHEYQRNVAKLHAERFANMPLDRFKSRIAMESGEEIIEKWKEKVSKRKQYRLKSEEPVVAEEEAVAESPATDEPEVSEEVSEEATEDSTEVAAEESEGEVPAEESPEAGEESVEATDDVEEVAEAEETPVAEEPEEEKPEAQDEDAILKSPEELARHFREHFAEAALVESTRAIVRGDVQGRDLSRGLLVHLKQENEKLRRGFPLPMIQALCRDFEKEGLRFFKRGKKALHVSSIRPKAISESVSLTASIQAIIDQILKSPGIKVANLLAELADDFAKPEKDQAPETIELTDKAKVVLKDLRWLTSEGYVIEFPDSKLALGKQPQAPSKKVATKAAPQKKAVAKPADSTPVEAAETPAATEAEAPVTEATETKAAESSDEGEPAPVDEIASPDAETEAPAETDDEKPADEAGL